MALAPSCDDKATKGSVASSATGPTVSRHSGIQVLRSAAPTITEAQFFEALDRRLDGILAEMRKKTYRSRMQVAIDLAARMKTQAVVRDVSKDMGVSDVSVLTLFARNPGVRKGAQQRVKERAQEHNKKLNDLYGTLPMVVKQDCREAAARRLVLKAAGKGQPSPAALQASPMVGVVLTECQTASKQQPLLKCYLEAADEAALKACD